MPTLQRTPTRNRKARIREDAPPAVSADRVREMLLEIAYVLHATRVVGRLDVPAEAELAETAC